MRRKKSRKLENITPYILDSRKERLKRNERIRIKSPDKKDKSVNFPPVRSTFFEDKKFPKNNPYRSILIWINTYNRPQALDNLLKDILKNKKKHKIKILLFDDASNIDYDSILQKYNGKLTILYQKMSFNHGKKNYWKLCTYAMSIIQKNKNFDYYIKLDDDGRLTNNFFDKCINIWESINDNRKICLNFRLDSREGKPVWTGLKPIKLHFNNISLYRSQWVDMDFFCKYYFFELLNFHIRKPNTQRFKNPYVSSGVGRDISIRLNKMGLNLYLTTQTLTIHKDHNSKMNPNERERTPLETKPITDPSYGESRG